LFLETSGLTCSEWEEGAACSWTMRWLMLCALVELITCRRFMEIRFEIASPDCCAVGLCVVVSVCVCMYVCLFVCVCEMCPLWWLIFCTTMVWWDGVLLGYWTSIVSGLGLGVGDGEGSHWRQPFWLHSPSHSAQICHHHSHPQEQKDHTSRAPSDACHACMSCVHPNPLHLLISFELFIDIYPTCALAAGVKQCLYVCVCVGQNILRNASSRVAKTFTDVIVNEKQSA